MIDAKEKGFRTVLCLEIEYSTNNAVEMYEYLKDKYGANTYNVKYNSQLDSNPNRSRAIVEVDQGY